MPTYPQDWASTMQPAIRAWVVDALGGGWAVIWGRQQGPGATGEGPRPSKPFASIQALDLPELGGMDAQEVDVSPAQMDVIMRAAGECLIEIQLFADDDQRAAIETLRAALMTQPTCDALALAGLSLLPDSAVPRDLSLIFSGAREFRYALEVPARFEVASTFTDQPFIETVDPPVAQVTP